MPDDDESTQRIQLFVGSPIIVSVSLAWLTAGLQKGPAFLSALFLGALGFLSLFVIAFDHRKAFIASLAALSLLILTGCIASINFFEWAYSGP